MHPSAQKTLAFLEGLGVRCKCVEHKAVYTIAEMEALHLDKSGEVAKNLFLRDNKKRRYFLVLIAQDKTADLRALSDKLGVKGLGFASENDLMLYLGLEKGSVTPLGILNDTAHRVELVLDEAVMRYAAIGMHPNTNTASVWITPADLLRVAEACQNSVVRMEL